MEMRNLRRAGAIAALAGLALILAGCLLSPGKFVSALDVRKDGQFTFTYTGEIHMLPLSEIANQADNNEFKPNTCFKDDSSAERPCTKEELDRQKADWEEDRKLSEERRKKDSEMTKSVLGGIDPDDPKAAEEIAARLRKQAGWTRVDYKGKGLFDVAYSISGKLGHDFSFPTIERFPAINPFVAVALRKDGTVRIDAPGFAALGGNEPMRAMLQMSDMGGKKDGKPGMPAIDGRFTITTNGTVLANNTEDGPKADPAGQKMAWKIDNSTPSAPMALIKLGS